MRISVNLALLPAPLRPGRAGLLRAGLLACAVFYFGISAIAFRQHGRLLRRGWPGTERV
ncbi:MAG: hypothetical protein RMK57_00325 [Bryobacterales bacterium]|nr:hypothetical protein [Bryobacteraceae bacterium]MDW8352951.1 hypothetical protein [Bryobacterales bacterium]